MSSNDPDHSGSDHESEDLLEYILNKARNRSSSSLAKGDESPESVHIVEEEVVEAPAAATQPTTTSQADGPSSQQEQQPVGVIVVSDDNDQQSAQIVQQLLRRTRYFDEEFEAAAIRCNNCGQKGHMAKDCRNERRKKPCFLCAQHGHESWGCPNRYCFKCGRTGHMSRDCSDRNMRDVQRVCLRCGREDCSGAGMGDAFRSEGGCSRDYLAADMKLVRCYVCHQRGHLCCAPAPREPAQMSCYNCGADDHWGEECGQQGTAQMEQERRMAWRSAPQANQWGLGGSYGGGQGGYAGGQGSGRDYYGGQRSNYRPQSEVTRWRLPDSDDDEVLFTLGSYQEASKKSSRLGTRRNRGR